MAIPAIVISEALDRFSAGEGFDQIRDWLLDEHAVNASKRQLMDLLADEKTRRVTAASARSIAFTAAESTAAKLASDPKTLDSVDGVNDLLETRLVTLLQRAEEAYALIPAKKRGDPRFYLQVEELLLKTILVKLKTTGLGQTQDDVAQDVDQILSAKIGQLRHRLVDNPREAATPALLQKAVDAGALDPFLASKLAQAAPNDKGHGMMALAKDDDEDPPDEPA